MSECGWTCRAHRGRAGRGGGVSNRREAEGGRVGGGQGRGCDSRAGCDLGWGGRVTGACLSLVSESVLAVGGGMGWVPGGGSWQVRGCVRECRCGLSCQAARMGRGGVVKGGVRVVEKSGGGTCEGWG